MTNVSMRRSSRALGLPLAHEAADGEQIVFPGAGHDLQTEHAHEVAEAILSLVPEPGSDMGLGHDEERP